MSNQSFYFKNNPRSFIVDILKDTDNVIVSINSTQTGEWQVKISNITNLSQTQRIIEQHGGTW